MKMQSFTVEEFQKNFDNLLDRVENGESFMITSKHGNAVMVPHKECDEIDELIRIHTDHEEGS